MTNGGKWVFSNSDCMNEHSLRRYIDLQNVREYASEAMRGHSFIAIDNFMSLSQNEDVRMNAALPTSWLSHACKTI
jgi:hypothetical protein